VTPKYNYAPRIVEDPAGDTVLLHTVSRRWQHKDEENPMRGMLAQPKKLVFDDLGTPFLGWYSALDQYFSSEEADKGGNGLVNVQLPSESDEIKIGMRLDTARKNGLEAIITNKNLTLQYAEDKYQISAVSIPDEGHIKSIKILLIGEFVEIYCNDRMYISTMAYRHFYGMFEAWSGKTALDFSFKPIAKKMYLQNRDDLNALV
jgi:hypothetical protein